MLVIKYIIEQPPGVTGISWAATNFHYLYPLANFYTPLYVPRLLSDALLLSLITVCFTAVAFPEEMITHFPGIASDPLPFPCTHVISKSSKRTCKWLEQFQQPKRKVKTASLLVLGSTWLMRVSSTGKGSCSLWPQKLADFTHQSLNMNSEQNKIQRWVSEYLMPVHCCTLNSLSAFFSFSLSILIYFTFKPRSSVV